MKNIRSLWCLLFSHNWYFKDEDHENFNFCTRCPVDRGAMRCGGLMTEEEVSQFIYKDNIMKPQIGQLSPEKIVRKYTMQEFWASLYWDIGDEDDDYDGFLHIMSNINNDEQIKIPIKDIIHGASELQRKINK